jgi:hypothetical protein
MNIGNRSGDFRFRALEEVYVFLSARMRRYSRAFLR